MTYLRYTTDMDAFFDFLKVVAVVIGILILVFIVLLSLPNSKLRDSLTKIYSISSFAVTIISAIYVLSPLDLIPDIIPVAGQGDDLVAIITGIVSAITGYLTWKKSKKVKSVS